MESLRKHAATLACWLTQAAAATDVAIGYLNVVAHALRGAAKALRQV